MVSPIALLRKAEQFMSGPSDSYGEKAVESLATRVKNAAITQDFSPRARAEGKEAMTKCYAYRNGSSRMDKTKDVARSTFSQREGYDSLCFAASLYERAVLNAKIKNRLVWILGRGYPL